MDSQVVPAHLCLSCLYTVLVFANVVLKLCLESVGRCGLQRKELEELDAKLKMNTIGIYTIA